MELVQENTLKANADKIEILRFSGKLCQKMS